VAGLVLADEAFAGAAVLTAFLAIGLVFEAAFFATGIDTKSKAAGLQSQ
jgi:hypothetical protein